ncbi:hypothetical protein [Agathobaculum desmolans]|nr:hypothetical protein [Agathobaculum desmolans]
MLGNPDLERKWLEMTYDGVMTVMGSRKAVSVEDRVQWISA